MTKCVLFLFNSSLYAMKPWLEAGVHCVSVDYHDTDHSLADARKTQAQHKLLTRLNVDLSTPWARADVLQLCALEGLSPALVLSFAPCTDLAVSGAAHFARKRAHNPEFQNEAVSMARLATEFGIPYAIENPVSVLSTLWRKPDYRFHPFEWAGYCPEGPHPEAPTLYPEQDRYNKKTCLWTGNGFTLPPRAPLEPLQEINPGHRALGGKSARTKHLRSLTPRGLSMAFFMGNYHIFTFQKADLLNKLA